MADVAQAFNPSVRDSWFLDGSPSSQSPGSLTRALRLQGSLNLAALRKSVESLIDKYQALWNFPGETHVASSHVLPRYDVLPISDFTALPIDTRESEARRYIREHADRSVDLTGGPLLSAALMRLSASENILLLSMQRSLCGAGVLMSTLIGDLSAQYNTEIASQSSFLPTSVPVPNSPRSSSAGGVVGRESHMLPAALMASVRDFSRAESMTPFTTLFAAFAAVLSRHSGQQRFLVGTSAANLEYPAKHAPSGLSNMQPLRADLSSDPSFRELLLRVRLSCLEGGAHLEAAPDGDAAADNRVPLTWHAEAGQKRDLPDLRLFQVALILEKAAWAAVHFSGLDVSVYELEARSAGLELVLHLEEHSDGLLMTADYDAALFDPGTIQRFLDHFEILLASAIADPVVSVSRLPLLTESERQHIVVEWNSPAIDYPSERCIPELFEEQVRKTPDAVAVVFEDSFLSYAELNRQSNQVAHYLRNLGVGPDRLVAICVERSLEMIVALLGVLKAGGAYVPLDPAYPQERLRYMLEDCAPVALLTQGHLQELFAGLSNPPPTFDLAEIAPAWKDEPETNLDSASVGLTSAHLAYVIYTSGSTGAPKGVMVEHRNVSRLFDATDAWFRFNGKDVWTLFHSYAFDFSVWEIWGALLYGGRLVIVSRALARSPGEFYKLICREKVTVLNQTPSAFRQLIAAQASSPEVHELRHVIFGGEALELSTLKPWYEQNSNQRTELINMYGITETTVHVTYKPLERADSRRGGSPIGRRIPDLRIYILDAHGEPVPIGVAGELHVGGAGVARGYLKRPELTAERFVADPFVDNGEARMYKTGDVGRWLPDGTIEFVGRNDFQVKIRGFRIELGEIEARLAEQTGVREAIVVAREAAAGDKQLVAYYTRDGRGAAANAEFLRARLSEKLPDYTYPRRMYRWKRCH